MRSSRPVSISHTLSVLSAAAETASLLVATQRNVIDKTRMALQRAEFAPTIHIPHLQRVVSGSGDGQMSVLTQRNAIGLAACGGSRPLSTSHTFSVLSAEAETASRPS